MCLRGKARVKKSHLQQHRECVFSLRYTTRLNKTKMSDPECQGGETLLCHPELRDLEEMTQVPSERVPALGEMVCSCYLRTHSKGRPNGQWVKRKRVRPAFCLVMAAHHQVESVCPGKQMPSLRSSTRNLLEQAELRSQEGRKYSTVAWCHRLFSFSGTWPGGNVEACNGTPGGNGTHTAADRGPAPPEPHARGSSL